MCVAIVVVRCFLPLAPARTSYGTHQQPIKVFKLSALAKPHTQFSLHSLLKTEPLSLVDQPYDCTTTIIHIVLTKLQRHVESGHIVREFNIMRARVGEILKKQSNAGKLSGYGKHLT